MGPEFASPTVGHEGGVLDNDTSTHVDSRSGQGQPPNPHVLTRTQTAFNADLSGVRVHAGAGEYVPSTLQPGPFPRANVVRRLIKQSEVPRIQRLSWRSMRARMQNPHEGEEPHEIKAVWLERNERPGKRKADAPDPVDPTRSKKRKGEDAEPVEPKGRPKKRKADDPVLVDATRKPKKRRADERRLEEDEPGTPGLSGKDLWTSEARKRKQQDQTLRLISDEKLALVLMVHRHGIFNPIGQGGNDRYIRSDKNTAINLIVGRLPQTKNKAGEIPDVFQDISPKEWRLMVAHLSKTEHSEDAEYPGSISEYIEQQRRVSTAVMECTKLPAPKKNETPLMTLIFDDNYTALNIHFPALVEYIKKHQEKESKKGKVGAGQAKGMTKFLMGRLMYLCNARIGPEHLQLVEQSSFGFQRPTLGDLGTNLSIRLSPGVSPEIAPAVGAGLQLLHDELGALMTDETQHTFGPIEPDSPMGQYWNGSKTKTPTATELLDSFNTTKTKLKHLLFTQLENGPKGLTIVGRTFERNHLNIVKLMMEDQSLIGWADTLLALHQPESLAHSLVKGTLSAPQMLDNGQLAKIGGLTKKDSMADQRLALFQAIAKTLEDDSDQDDWDEEGSDSEFEDDDVSGGKAVVPSGMASLSQLLVREDKVKEGKDKKDKDLQIGPQMRPGVYYEDFDHAKRNFAVAGYTPKDVVVVDLNPNLTTPADRRGLGSGSRADVIKLLTASGAKVWIVDMTSSTTADQHALYSTWKSEAKAELLITLVSGLKQQEKGLNTNPHGLTHWAYKGADKLEALKKYFADVRSSDVNRRSKVSNAMRRHHKTRGSYSWRRIGLVKKR